DRVATITLNRPEVLNAFNRQMCEEVRTAWRMVKDDAAVNAVVLRAEGDQAFCAGLDTKQSYGPPDDIWNHEDPGALPRPQWPMVKDDAAVNAVVLRAEGDQAFCAGLDTKQSYGQPDDIWNHEDPGELLSPKWQKVWKPVVCAVQGICTAGAMYFLNEADIVI